MQIEFWNNCMKSIGHRRINHTIFSLKLHSQPSKLVRLRMDLSDVVVQE